MDNVLTKIAEAVAAKLTYTDEFAVVTYPFVDRWTVGFMSDTFIENNDVGPNLPYLSIYGSPKYTRSWSLVRSGKTVSTITHVGTSTKHYKLSGTPTGAYSYVLQIKAGGFFGVATYKLSNDGGTIFGPDTIVPQGGKITIGDGSTFEFFGSGILVSADTYSWITEMTRTDVYRSYVFSGAVDMEIVAATEDEFSGVVADDHVGYRDQLIALFTEESGIGIDDFSWAHIILDHAPTVILDDRISKYRGLVSLNVEGELYLTRTIEEIAETITVTPEEN